MMKASTNNKVSFFSQQDSTQNHDEAPNNFRPLGLQVASAMPNEHESLDGHTSTPVKTFYPSPTPNGDSTTDIAGVDF